MKVVIPAAGRGLRFLPATKSMPKEMLPVVDRPVIQYVVEEAVASGSQDILIVTGRTKRAVEDHFDLSPELSSAESNPAMVALNRLSEMATIHFVRQRQARGLGDAIACAARHVGDEPFGVLLGDTINICDPPLLTQLATRFKELGGRRCVIAVEEVPESKVSDYGIVDGREIQPGVLEVHHLVEKPKVSEAPSRMGITGAYILTPSVFEAIGQIQPGRNGEIQLTDALNLLAEREGAYAVTFQGTRYDIGDRFIWLRTNLELALRDPELGPRIETLLRGLRS
jgi:UTP--glucose-1-phosphate uridylyltransferase